MNIYIYIYNCIYSMPETMSESLEENSCYSDVSFFVAPRS